MPTASSEKLRKSYLFLQARANGDNIWAIVKTASNQDGRMASPITAPSGQQQLALLKETYGRHGIDPCSIQYIEAHGECRNSYSMPEGGLGFPAVFAICPDSSREKLVTTTE